jgi:hypothetical protein
VSERVASPKVERALAVYAAHRWSATTRLCACGETFEATLTGHAEHKAHRMEKVLEAADAVEPFCDECNGPYDGWLLEQYGGHWDTCPNRAKALPPVGEVWPDSGVPVAEDPHHWSQNGGHP